MLDVEFTIFSVRGFFGRARTVAEPLLCAGKRVDGRSAHGRLRGLRDVWEIITPVWKLIDSGWKVEEADEAFDDKVGPSQDVT